MDQSCLNSNRGPQYLHVNRAKFKIVELKIVSGGYSALILLVSSWALWAVLASADLVDVAGGWLERDAFVSSVPLFGLLPWLGLTASVGTYAIWQVVARWRLELHRELRPWILVMVVFNALWVLCLKREMTGLSLICAFILLALLVRISIKLGRKSLVQRVDRWLTRACFGLFTGWLSIIVMSQSVAFVAISHANPNSLMFKGASALVLVLLALFLCAVTFKNPMGIYLNAGALWVVSWIIIDRYDGAGSSPLFATVSLAVAVLMLVCLLSALRTRIHKILSSH